jgi:hypothetical protein
MFFVQVNAERVVYYRERASNMYPVFFYSLSWTLAEVHKVFHSCIRAYKLFSWVLCNAKFDKYYGGIRMEE